MLRKFHAHFAVEKQSQGILFLHLAHVDHPSQTNASEMPSICLLLYCEIDNLSMCTYVWTIFIRDRHV